MYTQLCLEPHVSTIDSYGLNRSVLLNIISLGQILRSKVLLRNSLLLKS